MNRVLTAAGFVLSVGAVVGAVYWPELPAWAMLAAAGAGVLMVAVDG